MYLVQNFGLRLILIQIHSRSLASKVQIFGLKQLGGNETLSEPNFS